MHLCLNVESIENNLFISAPPFPIFDVCDQYSIELISTYEYAWY